MKRLVLLLALITTVLSAQMSVKVGSFAQPAATGAQAISGVGFQPKLVMFLLNSKTADGSAAAIQWGFGAAADATHRFYTSNNASDGGASYGASRAFADDHCIGLLVNNSATVLVEADFTSMDADGFTVNWHVADATARVVNYIALGGADLTNVTVGTYTTPTSVGNKVISGLGFQPDSVLLFGNAATTSPSRGTGNSRMTFGATSGVGADASLSAYINRLATLSAKYQLTAASTNLISTVSSTLTRAYTSSLDADGFTLYYTTAPSTAYYQAYIALTGGQFRAGSFDQAVATGNQAITTVGFPPAGVVLFSGNTAAASGIVTTALFSLGAGTSSTSRFSTWFGASHGVNPVNSSEDLDRTKIIKMMTPAGASPTVDASADLVSLDSSGFTVNWDTINPTPPQVLYWAFGSTATTPPNITTTSPLPDGTYGVAYSQALLATGGAAPYGNWIVTAGSLPGGLALTAGTGVLDGTPTATGVFSFTVEVTDAVAATRTKDFSLTILDNLPVISTASPMVGGTVGAPYSQTLAATGGVAPYTDWTVISGALPTSLTLHAATGVLDGTPTVAGNFTFTVQVTDTASQTGTKAFLLTISPVSLAISTASPLPSGVVMTAYSQTVVATGGTPAYTWTLTAGALPGGLALTAGTGVITGTPTVAGTFNFTLRVTDAVPATADKAFVLVIAASSATTGGLQGIPTKAYGSNLLSAADSGFETGHAWLGLNGGTINVTGAEHRTGTQSLAISATGSGVGVNLSKTVAWKVGRIRFWVKTSADPGASAVIYAYIFDNTHSHYSYACGAARHKLSMSGGFSDWTEYTLCDEVTESELHYGDSLSINISVSSIGGGATVYVDDVEVAPVLQPLVIFPTYPNYRGMLWTDQGATLRWAAAVEPTAAYVVGDLKVTVDVVRVSDGVVLATVTNDALEAVSASGQWAHFSINWMTYDGAALPNASYYLRGRLRLKSDESVLYTYPDYKIVKEAPATQRDAWRVWVDKDNRVRFRPGTNPAEPEFVHGVYFKNTGGAGTMGGADCCNTGDLVANNHRNIKLGCNHASLPVLTISNGSPATVTVTGHTLTSHDKITLSGATGAWTGLNGCYYWRGCIGSPGQVEVLTADTFTIPLDTTTFGALTGTVSMVRSNCEEDGRDTSFVPWNKGIDLTGATVWKQMANWGMNLTMRYGNWASARSGLSNTTCAYSASYDYATAYHTALQDYNLWNTQIVNSYQTTSPPLSSVPTCLPGGGEEPNIRYFLRQFVTLLPSQAGFAGFYLADEPGIWGVDSWGTTRQTVDTAYYKFDEHRLAGVGGLTWWTSTGPGQTNVVWNNLLDAHAVDPYPVGSGALPDDSAAGVGYLLGQKRHGRTWWWTHMQNASVFHARPAWAVLQLFAVSGSYPTLADSKIQAVSALAAGVTGILWWQFGSGGLDTRTQADYDNFSRVAKMIADLKPILTEPVKDLAGRADGVADYGQLIASVSDPAIKCSSRLAGTRILLACANTTNTEKSVTITLITAPTGKVVRAWDSSLITPTGAAFTDTFKGLLDAVAPENSVHMYLVEPVAGMGVR